MRNLLRASSGPLGERLRGVPLEDALAAAVARATPANAPPRLREALHYAMFPGGGRLRPRLLSAVALSAGGAAPPHAVAQVAAALECIHGASLVHDDLPCFDDAPLRRGRPALAKAFGEALAVLVGDALLLLAFDLLADVAPEVGAGVTSALVRSFARAAGAGGGLVAGQAWELEPEAPLAAYHRAKTGSLFMLAGRAGALLAKTPAAECDAWEEMGALLGDAYQAADDVADATESSALSGKASGRDEALARPNLAHALGVDGARARVRERLDAALARVPADDEGAFRHWLTAEVERAAVLQACSRAPAKVAAARP